jgi:hypothetical protein
MSDPQQLLAQFITADRDSLGETDPAEYLGRVTGTDRSELEALIDAYLAKAPRRPFDPAAFAASPARDTAAAVWQSMAGQAGRWPTVLPSLRHRAQITRAQLVARLAERLGASGREAKVAAYYHAMEHGTLPASGVQDRVLDALGAILGESASKLRELGQSITSSSPPASSGAAVFARVAHPDPDHAKDWDKFDTDSGDQPFSERDDIDELFTGASGG